MSTTLVTNTNTGTDMDTRVDTLAPTQQFAQAHHPMVTPYTQAYRSPSLSDTDPQGPTSIELSRHIHQNTQNLMVAETP